MQNSPSFRVLGKGVGDHEPRPTTRWPPALFKLGHGQGPESIRQRKAVGSAADDRARVHLCFAGRIAHVVEVDGVAGIRQEAQPSRIIPASFQKQL